MATTTNIIIVGGGIAGLSAAVALRASDRKITVLERSRMLRETGALISLQPNASKIVTSFGIEPFLAASKPMVDTGFRMFDVTGKLLRHIPLDTSRFGADRVVYHRQDLHSSLKAAAVSPDLPGRPAEIRAACPVVACDPEAGTVTLEGGEVLKGDLIVGADGIHSVVRTAVVGEQREAIPTGISAYRMLVPVELLKDLDMPPDTVEFTRPVTSMIVGHDKRAIMGPGRGGELFGIVALVPDEHIHENSAGASWQSEGSRKALREAFADFPAWLHAIFEKAPELALWQLRDIDPLPDWVRGRAILIGDAAHAMLPTQGQGASQSFEDAEALRAFIGDLAAGSPPTAEQVNKCLRKIYEARADRASLIQRYSREQGKPATDGPNSDRIKLDPVQFMQYNCEYEGAKEWLAGIGEQGETQAARAA